MFNCRFLVHHLARRAVLAAGLLAFTGLAGAADAPTPKPANAAPAAATPIDGWAVTLVTARAVVKPGDARALSDRFTRRSAIHAQATFTTEGNPQAGPVKFEVKWFNGQRRVSTKKIDAVVGKSPHYVAVQTSGNAVGEGDCRVEVFANGKLMASRRFRVDAV